MAFQDLQGFIKLLEERGQLVRVTAPVSSTLEISEIADRFVKAGGPALLFENVKGSHFPLAIGLMGTPQRMAWALGLDSLEELAEKVRDLIKIRVGGPLALLSNLPKLKHVANLPPRRVRTAPVQEVVWRGDEVDLAKLPILTSWPQDGGPFVTLPLVVTKDPKTGEYNMGMYRVMVMSKNTTGMHWQRHKTGARHLEHARELGVKLEVAVVLGGDPALIYAATAPLPPIPGINEYSLTGYLRGERQQVVRGMTVSLEVPANAEFVLEGYVDPEEPWVDEGPFGDHTGFYTPVDKYPRFHVTAITMRHNPVYPATVVGRPPMEDAYLIEASERLFLPAAQLIIPEIVDYHMPPAGVAHNLVIVSIKKGYPGQAYKVAHGLLGLGQMMFAKVVIVVDEGVPLTDLSAVLEQVCDKANVTSDVLHSRGPVDVLDHSSRKWSYGGKLIIDATTKLPEEQRGGEGERGSGPAREADSPNGWRSVQEVPQLGQDRGREKTSSTTSRASGVGTHGSLPSSSGQATATLERPAQSHLVQPGFLAVKLKKTRADQSHELGAELARDASPDIQHILICDELTDLRNLQDVWWTVLNNIDPERDVWLERSEHGGEILVWDAARKIVEEGFDRVWPDKIEMDPNVKARVDAMWHVWGLPDLG